jgi:hypothetical protein
MAETPRVFALERDGEEPGEIIGYGLVLPDGSAFAVSWPCGRTFYSTASAEESADLRGANLLWLGEQP